LAKAAQEKKIDIAAAACGTHKNVHATGTGVTGRVTQRGGQMSSSLAWGAAARLPAESEAKRGDDDGISSGVSRAAEAKSGHDDGTSSGVSRAAAHWFRPSLERRSAAQLEAEHWVLFFRSSGAYRRWMAVAPCVAVQACCGSIYSWSIFNAKMDTTVWHSPGTNAIGFLLSVAAYGSATFLLGAHIGRLGPFAGCARAAVLLPTAWALAAAASAGGSLLGLCIGYGVLLGVGIAHGYLSTTSVMQKWFPEYKGLAAGVAVAGFGLGAFGWTLLGKALLQGGASVPTVQLVFAGIIAVAVLAALPFMRLPPPGWQPAAEAAAAAPPPAAPPGVAAAAAEAAVAAASLPAAPPPPPPLTAASRQPDRDYTLAEAACTLEFWLVALLVFGSSMPGVVFLSSAADMAHYAFALNSADAFSITAAQNGINCLGRLGWGLASDRLGRKTFYLLAALGQALAVALMPAAVRGGQLALWLAAFLSIGSLYGGTFGVLPALTAELWGPGISSATHGAMLSFWALSAVVGVPIFTRVTATHAVVVVDPATGAASAQPTPDAYAVNAEWLLALPLAAAAAAAALNTRTRDRVLRRAAHQALRLRLPAGRVLVVGGRGGGGGGACCGCARPRCRVLNAEQQADEWAAHLAAAAGEQPAQPALQRAPPPP